MDAQVNEKVAVKADGKKSNEQTPSPYLVSVHVRDLLNLHRLPARLTVRETAGFLNCREHDIPVLVSNGLLTPLGHPPMNAQKYFAPTEVLELAGDRERMGEICDTLYQYWHTKNSAKTCAGRERSQTGNGGNRRSKRLR
jgi:hypothetical protein